MSKATRPASGSRDHDLWPGVVHQHPAGVSPRWGAMGDNAADDVFDWAARDPDRAMFSRKGEGGWQPVTAVEFAGRVAAVAAGLIAAGIRPGDRVGLMSSASLDWAVCDFAIWAVGGGDGARL